MTSPTGVYTCEGTDGPVIHIANTIGTAITSIYCMIIIIQDANFPQVPVMVNAVIITSSSATIQWSFPRLLEMRNETISIFYGTTSTQLGVITYPIYLVILIRRSVLFSSCLALDIITRYTRVMNLPTALMVWNVTSGPMIAMSSTLIIMHANNISAITSLILQKLYSLVLNWQPRDSPNGNILS